MIGSFLTRYTPLQGLEIPEGLQRALTSVAPAGLEALVYRARPPDDRPPALAWALGLLRTAAQSAPRNLVPLMPVDERSLACVVCAPAEASGAPVGTVLRWHLDDVPRRAQGQILDVDVEQYLGMRARELAARETGLALMDKVAETYHEKFGNKGIAARSHFVRPVRLAVQNVIVGLAAWRYDQTFDALVVDAWQVCEAPHLAAHEGARGLLALTLGEAFRSGSTMEIRFHKHPEGGTPAALQQLARVRGVSLGGAQSVLPAEARELMWQVCGLDPSLQDGLRRMADAGLLSPERACYSLLAGLWSASGLDYLIRVAPRVAERVLRGGSSPLAWASHRTELRLARRAFLTECVVKATGRSASDGIFEDSPHRLRWRVDAATAGVVISDACSTPAWAGANHLGDCDVILPRDVVDASDELPPKALLLLPVDAVAPGVSTPILRAPWTLADIDREVQGRMNALAMVRA